MWQSAALTKEIENLKRMLRDSNSQKSVVVVNRGGYRCGHNSETGFVCSCL